MALLGAGVLSVLIACSSDTSRPPPAGDSPVQPGVGNGAAGAGGDASTREASTPDAGDAGACNDIANNGLLVDQNGQLGDPLPSNGGTIVDGNYDLTQADVFVGLGGVAAPTGVSLRSSINVTAGVIQQVLSTRHQTSNAVETRSTQSYTVSGSTIVLTNTCPTAGLMTSDGYTASDTQLILTNPSTKEVFTFTKR
ncbi:hypothetical protein AKJ09_02642 [Labilithrix luteola]|uniref:Uncharacterized protein n=1 Tax=Labilithrix luteola TaxID=1391654 RepID=A0A0K1PR20_9BACT|nr:hypothetical protein AKJ09_02642 [Labilithrix luteola]